MRTLTIFAWFLAGTACGRGDVPRADRVLAHAAAAMGSADAPDSAGVLAVHATGTLDKAAEGQGHAPGVPSPGPLRETLAADLGGDGVRWDYREERYDGTSEAFGETYLADTLHVLLIHDAGIAIPFRADSFGEGRRRLRRKLPHLLVAELRERPGDLRTTRVEGGLVEVTGTLRDGTPIAVVVDPSTGLVRRTTYETSVPGRGPVTVTWWYEDYRAVAGGVRVPHRYGSRVGEHAYTDMAVDSVRASDGSLLEPPGDLRRLAVREAGGGNDPDPDPLEIRRLAPGIFRVPQVRSGFAPLVVEFDRFLVAVDAPASFPLLGQIPAGETDPGSSLTWATERFVEALEARWPDKPVRYTVLTHHHEDHLAGVGAFVAAGATVLAAPPVLEAVRSIPDLPAPLRAEPVADQRTITDGSQVLEILPVGENPHAAGMLVLRLPTLNAMYVSDLVTPAPLERYPQAHHAALDRFFARWLERRNLRPDSVWSMHGNRTITPAHLDQAGAAR